MSGTLAWLTFVAALIAAVGTFVGPIIAYRASIRTIQGEQQIESTRQRQEIVDRLIEQATGTNARLSTYALAQLEYLLVKKLLNTEQTEAARNAIDAVTARLEPEVEGGVSVEEDGDVERGHSCGVVKVSSVDVQRARLLIRLNDALGDPTPAYVRKIAEAKPANGHSEAEAAG